MTEEVERGVKSLIGNGYDIFKEYITFLFNVSFKYVNNKMFSKITYPLFSFIVFVPMVKCLGDNKFINYKLILRFLKK